MGVFRNRPLAFACVIAALAALFLSANGVLIRLPLAVSCLAADAGLFLFSAIRRRSGGKQTAACLALFLSGILLFSSWSFFDLQVRDLAAREGSAVSAEGTVSARLGTGGAQSRFALDLTELDGARTSRRVLLSCNYLSALRAGERVRLTATVSSFDAEGDAAQANAWIADGYAGLLICSDPADCAVISAGKRSFRMRLAEWNEACSERLANAVGGENGGLAAAFLLGNRSRLFATDSLNFRRAGVSHLLALSGLHVGILIAAVERLLRLLRVPRTARAFPVVGLSLVYLGLTGASPSTVRAALMAVLLYLAFLVKRNYDSFTAVATALFLILAVHPFAVADVGLWMSFCAAASIVVFLPAIRRGAEKRGRNAGIGAVLLGKLKKALLFALAAGCFAFCATLPLTAKLFGEASVLSVPLTMLLSPLVAAALVLSAVSLIAPLPPIVFAASRTLGAIRAAVSRAADFRGVTVRMADRRTVLLLAAAAVALLLCAVVRLRRRVLLGIPILLAIAAIGSAYAAVPPRRAGVSASYTNGGGYEYLTFAAGGKAVIADVSAGNRNYASDAIRVLHGNGCTELEALVLTHYHSSATYLLNTFAGKIKVRSLYLPVPLTADESAIAARIFEEAERLGVRCVLSDTCAVDGLTLQTTRDRTDGEPAVLLSAAAGEQTAVWFNAKAGTPERETLLREFLTRADVVIVGAHGVSAGTVYPLPECRAGTVLLGAGWETVSGLPPHAEAVVPPQTAGFRIK